MTDHRIGFIGLGNMGGRMSRRILDSGVPVLGFDAFPATLAASGTTAGWAKAGIATVNARNRKLVLKRMPHGNATAMQNAGQPYTVR